MKIDWDKEYGTIHGVASNGAKYEQDGLQFNNEGVCITKNPKSKQAADKLATAASAKASADAADKPQAEAEEAEDELAATVAEGEAEEAATEEVEAENAAAAAVTSDVKAMTRKDLMQTATLMGIDYPKNISTAKLVVLVEAAEVTLIDGVEAGGVE